VKPLAASAQATSARDTGPNPQPGRGDAGPAWQFIRLPSVAHPIRRSALRVRFDSFRSSIGSSGETPIIHQARALTGLLRRRGHWPPRRVLKVDPEGQPSALVTRHPFRSRAATRVAPYDCLHCLGAVRLARPRS
jgi:hypothetical protein